jgi:hypothetical protein
VTIRIARAEDYFDGTALKAMSIAWLVATDPDRTGFDGSRALWSDIADAVAAIYRRILARAP